MKKIIIVVNGVDYLEVIEYEKENFYIKNDILKKNFIVRNHRTQIRNQLPRKIRID